MKLSARLLMAIKHVPKGWRVADIGSDHGYLAIHLIQEKIASLVIAGEVVTGPLKAAEKNINMANLQDVISLRLGNGLSILKPGEVDAAVIAGMGGLLIIDILEAEPVVVNSLQRLILQPMIAVPEVRRWLVNHGWRLIDEELVEEEGRLYEVVVAEKGETTLSYADSLIGPHIRQKKPEGLRMHLEVQVSQQRRVMNDLQKSSTIKATEKYAEIKKKLGILEEELKWL